MRTRDTIICLVSIFFAAVLFFAAGSQLGSINQQRKNLGLMIDRPEDLPPSLAFATVATGAFRGLVVDILWMRAEKLKEQRQFFDAKQLADWITVLQRRFTPVWEFQSWNMAYNISVTIPASEPEERYRWVKNGYELLRDKGIVYNPKSIALYRQLALIFQHKIGGFTDDAHNFYKLRLALDMEPLLGAADFQYFKDLAVAPTDWRQVASDPNFTPIIAALQDADPNFPRGKEFIENYLTFRENRSRFSRRAVETLERFSGTEALKKFDIFVNAWQLRNVWKLQPDIMEQINLLYGPVDWNDPNNRLPLDWRHPDSHAIYWAYVGLKIAGKETFSPDEANTDRIVNHSLQNLFRQGKIFIYSASVPSDENSPQQAPQQVKAIYLRPDLRMFIPYDKSVLAVIQKYKDLGEESYISMQDGHRNLLKSAVLSFYQAGHRDQALRIFYDLRSQYPRDEFNVALDTFAQNLFQEQLKEIGLTNASMMIQMILVEAYFRYSMHDDDEAFAKERIASQAYDYYHQKFDEARVALPAFKHLKYLSFLDFWFDPQYPPVLKENLKNRIEIERPDLYKELLNLEEELMKQQEQMKKQGTSASSL